MYSFVEVVRDSTLYFSVPCENLTTDAYEFDIYSASTCIVFCEKNIIIIIIYHNYCL